MPNRILRDSALDSDRIAAVDEASEVLFYRLIMLADDFGRFDGRLSVIRARAFPLRQEVTEQEVERRLAELSTACLIFRYSVAKKPYIAIPRFGQRQRAEKSKFPEPPDNWLSSVSQQPDGCLTSAPVVVVVDVVEGERGNGGLAATARAADGQQPGTPFGRMAATLRALGVQVTPSHPLLVAWVQQGVTEAQVREAVTIARDRKPEPEKIPPAYLDPIIAQLLGKNGTAHSAVKAKPWFLLWSKIEEKGRELGVAQEPNEAPPSFRDRVYQAAGISPEQVRQAEADFR